MIRYKEQERFLRELPATWIPALLQTLVETAEKKEVFVKDGLVRFVGAAVKRARDAISGAVAAPPGEVEVVVRQTMTELIRDGMLGDVGYAVTADDEKFEAWLRAVCVHAGAALDRLHALEDQDR